MVCLLLQNQTLTVSLSSLSLSAISLSWVLVGLLFCSNSSERTRWVSLLKTVLFFRFLRSLVWSEP